MGQPERRRATYQDVLSAPDHLIAEILNGELVLSPRPSGSHASVTSRLNRGLGGFGRGDDPGGWIILFEPELHLGDDVVVPDLAGWRLERLPHVEDSPPYFTVPPDWVCETLSKWTERHDRRNKTRIYAAHGVGHLWFLHPSNRTLEVMRLGPDGLWLTVGVHADDDVVRAEPFAAIELDLARLWADLPPRPSRASELRAHYGYDVYPPGY